MKKKSVLNTFLFIVVMGIWGNVIIKFVKFKNTSLSPKTSLDKVDNETVFFTKDTFNLFPLVNDPFLQIQPKLEDQDSINNANIDKPTVITKIETPKSWPDIKYYGYVKGSNSKNLLVVLKINSVLYKKRINSETSGILLKKIFKDSIEVEFERSKKIIKRVKS
jgi:hypothetical protein